MYQLQLFLHRDTDNVSIGQCWHTLHNSHLHHKDNRHYWLHHCNGHFQPALHNHNLKIGAKYILINVISVVQCPSKIKVKKNKKVLLNWYSWKWKYQKSTIDFENRIWAFFDKLCSKNTMVCFQCVNLTVIDVICALCPKFKCTHTCTLCISHFLKKNLISDVYNHNLKIGAMSLVQCHLGCGI